MLFSELVRSRGGKMWNEGPGEMASSLSRSPCSLIRFLGLFSAVHAEVAGAEGQVVIIHRPRDADQGA